MPEDWDGPDFEFKGRDVGHFLAVGPTSDGPARYAPFRGPGHHALAQALDRGEPARCSYAGVDGRVSFDVVDSPDYGVLILANFLIA